MKDNRVLMMTPDAGTGNVIYQVSDRWFVELQVFRDKSGFIEVGLRPFAKDNIGDKSFENIVAAVELSAICLCNWLSAKSSATFSISLTAFSNTSSSFSHL